MTYDDSSLNQFLEGAARIGDRIVKTARWNGNKCLWDVWTIDRSPGGRRGIRAPAGAVLYQGTGGTALFLSELYRMTGDPRVLACAEGGLRHAFEEGTKMERTRCGMHSGRIGIAFAHVRHGLITENDEHLGRAIELLDPLASDGSTRVGDVIGGEAGAIPGLLAMTPHVPADPLIELARDYGDRIIRGATRGEDGWSWSGRPSAIRNLAGFSHGASGYGFALLELYAMTGDEWYRYGAEEAFRYERALFDPTEQNWPDFRDDQMSEFELGNAPNLRERLRAGEIALEATPMFMSAWCHGAPGIALARLRAWELLGDAVYREEARTALNTTIDARCGSYSLCHGYFGNAESLLVASDMLADPELETIAKQIALTGYDQYGSEDKSWPCGTYGSVSDPSLLLGEAGIGHFFLRLCDRSIPSILYVTGPPKRIGEQIASRDVNALKRQSVELFFQRTIATMSEVAPDWLAFAKASWEQSVESPALTARRAINTCLENSSDARAAEAVRDAFKLELCIYELTQNAADRSRESRRQLARLTLDEIRWESHAFHLSSSSRIITTARDWLHRESARASSDGSGESVVAAVYMEYGRCRTVRLSTWAALVLSLLDEPRTLPEIVEQLQERIDGLSETDLWGAVEAQLSEAYSAGIVDCVEPEHLSPVRPATTTLTLATGS